MKIHSSDTALYGQKIDVQGTMYEIGADGAICGVAAEHAKILLTFRGYRVLEMEAGDPLLIIKDIYPPIVEFAPPKDKWEVRGAELAKMTAKDVMKIGRKLGLKIVGKSGAELARDILECEKKSEAKAEAADAESAES